MSLSVDGGNPVTIDDYAPSRNASVTVPQKESQSSGNNIAVDLADIS